ncbi:PEP/pyruvate-binding domain-containing protein [Streptosporangium roseum]|uniref:Phosphoenolpyruvate synthase/pyruvate phosphate dikinase-like protein n=1 Tax=Streptosporangium roseum (strain ATCC 12428 / DSM 43021 / JCM 3005 / KCTC 9067 / NCIMB 10171 / NRRL 2505 / NI 9100) TaxID=479432 RepID=D2AUM0_STRRD|nr:PEP/pyruvate-binding domain-containing protein [Streptosporangium roseum]ACZ84882.1 Phosphoenolpyruvate synthase/pyruvate phosphate dikinase-like protein [Streptosporangium roseum DSM 43021]
MYGTPLILKFDDIDAGMLPLVGGKAANLGVLTAAGLPVPPGLCVTTEAYRRVTEQAGLEDVLDALAVTAAGETRVLNELAGRARELVLSAPVPADIADAVRRSAHGPVAVRSSATAEDLPHASFAGQQDTYLNVIGADAVLDAVRRCWASLWTDRAVAYRAANGIDHRAVLLAVVIQEMVQSEVAGVMFTANPVTGRRREAVIDASPGLGEAVVSGAVNPDHFVVDTATGRITARRLGDKRLAVRSLPGGGVEHVETAVEGACVTDAQVRALAELGGRVEDHYGSPQDTEWAVDAGGALWLTQARPITTLFPIPRHPRPAGAGHPEDRTTRLRAGHGGSGGSGPDGGAQGGARIYFSFSVAQGIYAPITPMGMSAFRLLSSSAAALLGTPVTDRLDGAPQFAEAASRMFIDVTGIMRSRVGRMGLPRVLDVMEARSATVLRGLSDDPRFSVTQRSVRPALRRLVRNAIRFRIPARAAQALVMPEKAHRRAERLGVRLRTQPAAPAGATALERLDHVERILGTRAVPLLPTVLPGPLAGFAMLGLAYRLLGDRARPGELQTVLRGLPHNVTTEMDLALWHLATRIRADREAASLLLGTPAAELAARFGAGSLPGVVDRGLKEFLSVYGVRAVAEIDLGVPRWSEDPTHVIGVLANYLRLEDPALSPDALFARGAAEAVLMIKTLSARVGGVRGRVVRFALGRARALAGVRELPKFYMVTILAAMRAELVTVGADLTARGLLDSPRDIFFLTLEEARTALTAASGKTTPEQNAPTTPEGSTPATPGQSTPTTPGGRTPTTPGGRAPTAPGQSAPTTPGDAAPPYPAGLRALVSERREDAARERRRRHLPRVLLSDGTEPEAVATSAPVDGALTGTPASAGSVTGIARVVLDPVGAHLEPGEILVCPSTDPGWTPLFLTAGGLVMEMGGANSHGAVVAREYGIPAVVGVARATEHIVTGQRITLDGTSGAVITT